MNMFFLTFNFLSRWKIKLKIRRQSHFHDQQAPSDLFFSKGFSNNFKSKDMGREFLNTKWFSNTVTWLFL